MAIEPAHFISTLSPQEKMSAMNALDGFSNGLSSILAEELMCGNQIVQVWTHVPKSGAIAVVLSKPFRRLYEGKDFLHEILDPHEGHSRYTNTLTEDSLTH